MKETSFEKFTSLCEKGTVVPVVRELLSDMDTPVSVLKRFEKEENVFLFESVESGERFGRYSFLGITPRGVFEVRENKAFYRAAGEAEKELPFDEFPLDALRRLVGGETFAVDPELPPLPGGAVGFLGYEAVRMFEDLPEPKNAPETPDALFLLTDRIIAFDNLRRTAKLIVCVRPREFPSLRAAYDAALAELNGLAAGLDSAVPRETARGRLGELRPSMTKEAFCRMVEAGKRHIVAGDVIQVVLSQKFEADCTIGALQLYRALRLVNPSPYTFFLKASGLTLIGSSPETLVKLAGRRSCVRPIAGTRRRGADEKSDRALADELLSDPKERAEHLMLVDLGRNDLGRTALPGSVQVKDFMKVERYSHVMHLVSTVEAELASSADALELLRTTFPAGTLSGAPKLRAMELIHELEPESRGVYGGAVGYLSGSGSMDMAITIRTLALKDGVVSIQAGAGIVFDSDPEAEYQETLNKAGALFQALKLAANGLEL